MNAATDNNNLNELGIRLPVMTGLLIIFLFFGVLGLWSLLAPLQSAAIAQGVLAVDSQRKTIQHLEGGIVSEIRVTEGQQVDAGEVLVVLDDTQARARLELLNGRLRATRAQESRLIAEREGNSEITYNAALLELADTAAGAEIVQSQENIFAARRQALNGQIAILRGRISQHQEEVSGLTELVASLDQQIRLVEDEIISNEVLVAQGLSGKTRLLELQREHANLLGRRSQSMTEISRARQNIDEARLQMTELSTTHLNEVVAQLRDIQTEIYDLTEQIRSAKDILSRTEIRATQGGTVVDIQVHTIGGVVAPGQDLLDIVPVGDEIIVEARIDPADIDVVQAGLEANVRLTAYSHRNLLPIAARVLTVSADSLTDNRTNLPYYLARIKFTGEVDSSLELYPGMQTEVMVVTGERTLVDYLTWPLRQSFNRALREN